MNLCTVELIATPADEHFHLQGFAVRVEIVHDRSACQSAHYWRRTTAAMEWLEHENPPELRAGAPSPLRDDVAAGLLGLLRAARISPHVEGLQAGIHATKFQLAISSAFLSCSLSWSAELPPEWSGLAPLVHALELIGRD